MLKKFKGSLALQVLLAMILGIIAGLTAGDVFIQFGFIGTIWLNCIKMVIIPMILTTLVVGIISQKDVKALGRVSFRIIFYYILTTVFAAIAGIVAAKILNPGSVANISSMKSSSLAAINHNLSIKFVSSTIS